MTDPRSIGVIASPRECLTGYSQRGPNYSESFTPNCIPDLASTRPRVFCVLARGRGKAIPIPIATCATIIAASFGCRGEGCDPPVAPPGRLGTQLGVRRDAGKRRPSSHRFLRRLRRVLPGRRQPAVPPRPRRGRGGGVGATPVGSPRPHGRAARRRHVSEGGRRPVPRRCLPLVRRRDRALSPPRIPPASLPHVRGRRPGLPRREAASGHHLRAGSTCVEARRRPRRFGVRPSRRPTTRRRRGHPGDEFAAIAPQPFRPGPIPIASG